MVKNMKFNYFPGCTLKNKAKDLDRYARLCADKLGVELCEIPEWQCCGGVFTTALNDLVTKLSSIRALEYSRDNGGVLVSVCSGCHNVLKQTNEAVKRGEPIAKKSALYMGSEQQYAGETEVIHYLEMLRDKIGFDKIKAAVTNPLTGRRIATYYGCLLLRPASAMRMDDPENPTILEDFVRAIGAEPVITAQRNECCGGYVTLEDRAQAEKRSGRVMSSFEEYGADSVITACPLCMYNLRKNSASSLPVIYFTELLAEALGIKDGDAE